VDVDPLEAVARIGIQGQQLVLKEGEWSGWVPVGISADAVIGNVKGICRFYSSKRIRGFSCMFRPSISIGRPRFANFHAIELLARSGETDRRFHTQGIAEDTKALTAGVLDDKEYLEQARTVLAEHRRAFDVEFPKFQEGLFLFYFSSSI